MKHKNDRTKLSKFIVTMEVDRLTKAIKNSRKKLNCESYDWKHEETQEKLESDIERRQSFLDEFPEYFI